MNTNTIGGMQTFLNSCDPNITWRFITCSHRTLEDAIGSDARMLKLVDTHTEQVDLILCGQCYHVLMGRLQADVLKVLHKAVNEVSETAIQELHNG